MGAFAKLKLKLYRATRYSGVVERLYTRVKRSPEVPFPELGMTMTLQPGDLVIDCGAHIGDMTSRFARTGATVHAFEPNPLCFAILAKRFARMPNVVLHNNGTMAAAGTLPLRIPVSADPVKSAVAGTFMAVEAAYTETESRTVEIACIDFPAFVAGLGQPVKLLKMDIEGAEVDILDAMLDQGLMAKVGMAVVETHDRFSAELARKTDALRQRLDAEGLSSKVRLDWI